MTTTVSTDLSKSRVLNYYYQRRAESQIGNGVRFLLKSVVFGTSSLVTSNNDGTYAIADIPADFEVGDLLTQVASGVLTLSYSDGYITIRAAIDTSKLADNVSYPINTFAILDAEGKAVAIQCVQQDSIYQGKSYVSTIKLKTGGVS